MRYSYIGNGAIDTKLLKFHFLNIYYYPGKQNCSIWIVTCNVRFVNDEMSDVIKIQFFNNIQQGCPTFR